MNYTFTQKGENGEKSKMQLSKRQITALGLALTLTVINIAVATVYMNKDVMVTGGVATSGTIEVYEEDGTTIMNSIAMPQFQGTTQTINHFFWVKNTGNVPVAVYWNISSGNPNSWSIDTDTQIYLYRENSQTKFNLAISKQTDPSGITWSGSWDPDPTGNQVVSLGTGQTAEFALTVAHITAVNTPGTFSFVLSFYAKSP